MEYPMKSVRKFRLFPSKNSEGARTRTTTTTSPNAILIKREVYIKRVLKLSDCAFQESQNSEKTLPTHIETLENQYEVISTPEIHKVDNGKYMRIRKAKSNKPFGLKLKYRTKPRKEEIDLNTERLFLASLVCKLRNNSLLSRVHDMGFTEDYRFIVVDDVGPDLMYFIRRHHIFNTVTTFLITYYSFMALRELHLLGFLHCDLRPSSFCISTPFHLRLVDFYFVQPMSLKVKFNRKTDRFSARAFHQNVELDENADIECWLYTMMFLTSYGSLPWNASRSEEEAIGLKQLFFSDQSNYSWVNSADCLNMVPLILEKQPAKASEKIYELLQVNAMSFNDNERPQMGERIDDVVQPKTDSKESRRKKSADKSCKSDDSRRKTDSSHSHKQKSGRMRSSGLRPHTPGDRRRRKVRSRPKIQPVIQTICEVNMIPPPDIRK
ncbi:unnamed protein product [Caenorhabditis auriculariae]|uniref:Protein kinase domain-containing protein n=1 Tax=Caenorhabditis auriculariae TaxID=2777116 RepID=A0A8S1GWG3_9PELO|nr:unnamed protein product [Caenorhabditis auriculariae]